MALDIGPETTKYWTDEILKCKTVIWNGPVGMFERLAFSSGTFKLLQALNSKDITSIVCGGDTGSAVKQFSGESFVSHISTGGGASLELLEGKELPGIKALTDDFD